MTVKEMISFLSKMPDDTNICIETVDGIYFPKEIKLWINPEDKNIYECYIKAEE